MNSLKLTNSSFLGTSKGYPCAMEKIGKFEVLLSFEDEYISPYDVYDNDDEYGKEDIQNILDGKYTWVIAIVTVFKNGIELAKNTLGCCEYNYNTLVKEFKESGYYDEMVKETINEANEILSELLK
jgi:hypothetical protein